MTTESLALVEARAELQQARAAYIAAANAVDLAERKYRAALALTKQEASA